MHASVFNEVLDPVMIGPSSSHTAGAARLGGIARRMAGGDVHSARVTLYGSFAVTGRGHGTDRAVTAGLLGLAPDDERLREAFELAREQGVEIEILYSSKEVPHPNTARIAVTDSRGQTVEMAGVSVGGGRVEVRELNGMEVAFGCNYPTLLLFYRDQPGVVSLVTGLLAQKQINIAFMRVFRDARYQNACMVIESDEAVTGETLREIRAADPLLKEVRVL